MLVQGTLESVPAGIIAQRLQHGRQAVVTDIQRVDLLPRTAAQGMEPLLRPGFDLVQPMIRFRQEMGQPDHGHPALTEARPVAVHRKVLVQQGCTPIRSNWASNKGMSSTRSLIRVSFSVMPRPYHNVRNCS